jgi:hypothetical protein
MFGWWGIKQLASFFFGDAHLINYYNST